MSRKAYNSVSLPVEDIANLRIIADEEHRSMAQQVSYWINQHLQGRQKEAS